MPQPMDSSYIITGINKLTGLRERISALYGSKESADKHCSNFVAIKPSKRIYKYPKVEVYHKNLFD
jgi:hypothetical protein